METLNQHALNPDSERRLRAIQRAFRKLHTTYDWRLDSWSAPWRRSQRLKYWGAPALLGAGLGFAALAFFDLNDRFGSADLAARHIFAAPNCSAAQAAGLAPAWRGHPGYYERHDRDDDGVACELWR